MKCLRSNFIIFALVIYGASQLCGTSSSNERSKFNHLLLKAVQQTLRFFKMPNVYIFNYDSESSPNTMIRMFHENLFPTSIGSEVTSDFQVRQGPKIIILTVKNCADIVGPILSLDSKLEISRNSPDVRRTFQPQRVCADSHEKNQVGETNTSKTCNLPWSIGEAVLREGSRLPKRLKELRQRLMLHPVWNAANYLIFAVRINDVTQCDLPLVFKLIWRLFRGHKTVICLDERCLNYDPFNDVIHSYTIESEVYFDFSISNLRGKRITALLYFRDFDNFFDLKFWSQMMDFLVRTFRDHVGGSQVGTTRTAHFQGGSLDRADFTKAIEDDAEVIILEDDLRNLDFRHLEVLSVLDSGQICFIVPERGPMPSYLTPVKCFTGAVWRFIFGTIVLFVIVHEIYRRFCIRVENSQAAENVSTVFAVYSYVLCVGQSRLLVDFSTGKILFGIFSFSFLILSSVFLSLMVDNLSKRLRYAPLNTVEEVRDSELLLQSVNRSLDNYLFSDEPRYEWIKERFINSWEDIWVKRGEAMAFANYNENQTDVRMFSWIGANISEVIITLFFLFFKISYQMKICSISNEDTSWPWIYH